MEVRPPVHYALACEIVDEGGVTDAQIVVACNEDIPSSDWFSQNLEDITCPSCRVLWFQPVGRVHRFVDGAIAI